MAPPANKAVVPVVEVVDDDGDYSDDDSDDDGSESGSDSGSSESGSDPEPDGVGALESEFDRQVRIFERRRKRRHAPTRRAPKGAPMEPYAVAARKLSSAAQLALPDPSARWRREACARLRATGPSDDPDVLADGDMCVEDAQVSGVRLGLTGGVRIHRATDRGLVLTFRDVEGPGRSCRVVTVPDGAGRYRFSRAHVDRDSPRMLPTQAIGVCYFHSCMCMIMNNHAFLGAFLEHLRSELDASPYRRLAAESPSAASARRFGNTWLQASVSERVEYDRDDIGALLSHGTKPELYYWCRNVMLLHSIEAAKARADAGAGRERADRPTEAQAFFVMKDVARLDVSGDRYAQALRHIVGYSNAKCFEEIFRMSRMHVHTDGADRMNASVVVGKPPGSPLAFVFAEDGSIKPPTDLRKWAPEDAVDCGETAGGIFMQRRKSKGGSSAHSMAYVRDDERLRVVDPNDRSGRTRSVQAALARYCGTKYSRLEFLRYQRAWTCFMPSWVFPKTGGGGDDGDDGDDGDTAVRVLARQASEVTPAEDDIGALAGPDGAVPREVLIAAAVMRDYFSSGDPPVRGGGGRAEFAQWAALVGVVVAMATVG